MNWKKSLSFMLVLSIMFLIPFSKAYAEEEENNDENPDEIIEREDTPTSEDIPDPPRDETLIGEEEDVHEVEIETPSSVTGEKMEGSGTVVDFSTTGARAFYTIVDNDNNTFYLIIDMDKADNNVYFLSDINKEQLTSGSSESTDNKNTSIIGNNEETEEVKEESEQALASNSEEKEPKEENSSNLTFLLVVVSIGLVGALGYHFFIRNKKQKKDFTDEIEDDEIEDDEMLEMYEDNEIYENEELIDGKFEGENHNESDDK